MLPAHPHEALLAVHAQLRACRRCPRMVGRAVHGPAVASPVLLVGQAPGVHEEGLGRPFAWTAGRTLFRWLHEALGADEEAVRARLYFSAVARCFPGKAKGGGDRKPDPEEVLACRPHLAGEVAALAPRLVLPVGALAIAEVLGHRGPLAQVVGTQQRVRFHGHEVDVIALPHPSGASTWHRTEPGQGLLRRALALLGAHPAARALFAP
ncbi:uracil-DNA glycosylase [Aggregicoccus sp. 17bor-14]|uniref:uracil-DNA glycosylase family protein n=1 Tax=Myxococcaceae TaxID=31 RepID=UPI00129D0D99|nr:MULTISPECIES: uracil-DNA glycosylase family protein [Myxococcaceae]MBF5045141.1 uracil-DNA glycosylase [Simulacricoccus sp. 17bor-14]MRI90883.1 uracil-DNA glycosylase [Aggregicoccus sp. 17bor-14]